MSAIVPPTHHTLQDDGRRIRVQASNSRFFSAFAGGYQAFHEAPATPQTEDVLYVMFHRIYRSPTCSSIWKAGRLAENPAPFAGGQNARQYQAVSAQDMGGTATALERALRQQVTSAYQAELDGSESLVLPVACHAQVTSDHAQGSQALHVMITVTEACPGIACQSAQLYALVFQALIQRVRQSEGSQFHLESTSLHAQVTAGRQQAGAIHIEATGMLAYQWSVQEQAALATLIAGKSEMEATTRCP